MHRTSSAHRPTHPDWHSCIRKWRLSAATLLVAITTSAILICAVHTSAPLLACGPDFPNALLSGGDESVLRGPVTDFEIELKRIKLPPTFAAAVTAESSQSEQTAEADLTDLQSALKKQGVSDSEATRLYGAVASLRQKLQEAAEDLGAWQDESAIRHESEQRTARPVVTGLTVPSGLPREFQEYLSGSVAFYAGDTNRARQAWEHVLQLPAQERRYRSTWSAFMLGKVLLVADPQKAVEYFQQVRQLTKSGFADPLGLAASSYGWEAKAELNRGQYPTALRLYLQQERTGDSTAIPSIRQTVRMILARPREELNALAADPIAAQIMTGYFVSRRSFWGICEPDQSTNLISSWIGAVESAGAAKVESADRMALAAYQHGLVDHASRWLKLAPGNSAMAQWLRAKLLLRSGKVDEAAKLLAQVVRLFPREGDWKLPEIDSSTPMGAHWDDESPVRQAQGEWGVLLLARRQYYEALDTLLRAGYWSDAAYIAEYVLTPDELMAYVDRQWPPPEKPSEKGGEDSQQRSEYIGVLPPNAIALELRYLVARRLGRLERFNEALDFYPSRWKTRCEVYAKALDLARNATAVAGERADAFWQAAQIMRHEGMELFGTEVEPDWHLFDGQYDWDHVSAVRVPAAEPVRAQRPSHAESPSPPLRLVAGTADEQRRVREHKPKPDDRFHYRYLAANLAWEASLLMPNNTSKTAEVLWTAGTWLKARDPQAADRFYKALVRRCRHTWLGQEADRLRWFPKTTHPSPPNPGPEQEIGSEDSASTEPSMETPELPETELPEGPE